ncbi:MAG TPA: heavy metal sensor histidine kinase [Candidatus Methylomirabilis sp.]|nr:heavy metal sensor histidine kinase [Candidatus Methylomirabilis sp.]
MFDSVRVRLTLWYSAVLAVVLIVVCATTYLIVRRTSMQRTDTDMEALADSFVVTFEDELADAGSNGNSAILSAAHQAMIEHRTNEDVFLVLGPGGEIIANSRDTNSSNGERNSPLSRALASGEFQRFAAEAQGQERELETIPHPRYRAYARHLKAGARNYLLIVLHSLHAQYEVLEAIRLTFAWMILVGLLLAGTGGYFLARKSLGPVVAMGTHARRIGATNLHERLPVQNANDELGKLATTFNDLLNRLEQSFERQRRFIADASHELRTPLAILRGEAEVAMSQPGRKAEDYRESLRILQEETSRLIKIVEDLFTLSRADSGQYALTPQDVYLEEVVADCAHSARTLAREKNIELSVDASAECLVRGDQTLLRRMILNLLDNAIKYTSDGGRVEIACRAADTEFEVHVTDSGPGIPSELQSRIFERFFRADPARSRSGREGGAGLGLSIALWIAQAHAGRLELLRSDASGSHFAVYLPAAAAVPAAVI